MNVGSDRTVFLPPSVGSNCAITVESISIALTASREEVHQPSEQANDGENHQAHDEQVFHHTLTACVVEKVNHS